MTTVDPDEAHWREQPWDTLLWCIFDPRSPPGLRDEVRREVEHRLGGHWPVLLRAIMQERFGRPEPLGMLDDWTPECLEDL